MTTLHEILWDLKNDDLAYRIKLLGVKLKGSKKAGLIDTIKAALTDNGLQEIWTSLKALEQAAVAEACYTPDHSYNPAQFKAKYGDVPSFSNKPEDAGGYRTYSSDSKYATRLNLFLFTPKGGTERIVPFDLAERLRVFIPKPQKLSVSTLVAPPTEDGLLVRQTEHEALVEVMALLRLAEVGDLRISAKTGKVSSAGCHKILDCLIGGDFYPLDVAYRPNKRNYEQEIGAIKPIAWARLLQVGGYFTQSGTKSKLTASGIKALSLSPEQVIEHLWKKWLANTSYDEFNRVEDIKGQRVKGHMTAKPPRRDSIVDALSECPANKWITVEKFSDYMQGTGQEFEVSRDLWKLYLCEARYGSLGYAGCGDWNIVQLRYILCFLFEYAAPLGLIDIAYVHPVSGLNDYRRQWGVDDLEWLSRYDGLRAFRITKLGAYCFGIASEYKPTSPSSSLVLTVLPSLRICMNSGALLPTEKLLLETWAELVEPNVWQLEVTRALEAVERGQSATEFADFLQARDSQPLPETVTGFLRDCQRNGTAVRHRGEAYLFDCRDADTARLICAQAELQGQCYQCSETKLAIMESQLPKFRKVVRSLGLGVV